MASRLIVLYNQALVKYPVRMQALQVAVIMGTSDLIAQCAIEKAPVKEIDWRRTSQFAAMGFFLVGPSLKIWYGKLDTIVSRKQKDWQRGIKKVSLDQLVFAPCFTVVFTSCLSVIQGLKPDQIVERLRKDYVKIMTMNYKLWPAAQMVNFTLVPLNFQVVFAQTIAVIWNIYLSTVLGKT